MKHFLLALALAASGALAAPLAPLSGAQSQALVAHCQCVMNAGLCVLETRQPIASGPVQYGSRLIQAADANFLTEAGPRMCEVAKQELSKDTTSDRSFVIRQRWRSDFIVCKYPAQPH